MSSLLLSLTGVLLEVLVLYRAFRSGCLRAYPLFNAYLGCVLLVDISCDIAYRVSPSTYPAVYWTTLFLTLIVGYGVILEVTRKAFDNYPGVERLSRAVVLGIFMVVFAYVGLESLGGSNWSPENSFWELERDLRAVQALVLAGALGLIAYYQIQIGRNLKGIILGYGLYTVGSIVSNELRSYGGTPFHVMWRAVQPYTYLVCLFIWTVALWLYQPNPEPEAGLELEADYESLAGRTKEMVVAMRSLLERSARP
jgi:hypothetical protein